MSLYLKLFGVLLALVLSFTDGLGMRCAEARRWPSGVAATLPEVVEQGCSNCEILEHAMNYRYYLPENYDASVEYPLVLFLHGSGESGSNNKSQVSSHVGHLIDRTDTDYPAIFVAPQLYQSIGWSPFLARDRTDEILEKMIADFSVDTDRLYITGLSMGGFGTMNYLEYFNVNNPDILQFAAAMPTAGSGISDSSLDVLREVPIWIGHGSSDGIVDPDTARGTYNALAGNDRDDRINFPERLMGGPTAISGNTLYTEYPGVGHGSWERFYSRSEMFDWMFSHSLTTVPEPTTAMLVFAAGIFGLGVRPIRREK